MKAKAFVGALIAAAVAAAIVFAITLWRGTSFTDALTSPDFWLVEGATILLTALAMLSESDEATGKPPRSAVSVIVARAGWATIAAVGIGALLALVTDIPILDLLTNIEFLIPAAIAVTEPPRVLCTPGFLGSDRLIGSLVGIVAVFGFGWCGAAEAVHESLVVEPVNPVGGDVLDVGEGA